MNCIICGKELTEKQISKGQKVCSRSCSMKNYFSNIDNRKKLSSKVKKSFQNKEVREKHKLACKIWYEENCRNNDYLKNMSEGVKRAYQNKEVKQKMIKAVREALLEPNTNKKLRDSIKKAYKENPEYREKISKTTKEHWKDKNFRDKCSKGIKEAYKSKDLLTKINATKRKNNSFNTSKPEQLTKELLQQKFKNVQYQYKDERYPYLCDFYIPSLDLFIELNYHWTHYIEPYDKNNTEHQNILKFWKSKNSRFYDSAIDVWTKRDVEKLECFKKNSLNFKIFYSHKEFLNWFNTYKGD